MEVLCIIKEYYNDIKLSADAIHLNDIPFLISLLENTHYRKAIVIDNMKCFKLENELRNVIYSYTMWGFQIILIIVDIQFKALKDRNAIGVAFNVVAHSEHVLKIEQFHEVIKERYRYYYAILPFASLLRMMVVHLMIQLSSASMLLCS